jgi:hypothetical protein
MVKRPSYGYGPGTQLWTTSSNTDAMLFTNGGTCLFDIVHQWSLGLQIPSLHARRLSTVLVGHVCCIHNIPQYRLSPVEYRQTKFPSSYQLHHLVFRHLSQVVKNPPCSGFEPGTSRTRVRRSNHYTKELMNTETFYRIILIFCPKIRFL